MHEFAQTMPHTDSRLVQSDKITPMSSQKRTTHCNTIKPDAWLDPEAWPDPWQLGAQTMTSQKNGFGAAHAVEMHQTCRLDLCRCLPHRLSWARLPAAVTGLLVLMMTWLWGLGTQENHVILHRRGSVGSNTVDWSRACNQNHCSAKKAVRDFSRR